MSQPSTPQQTSPKSIAGEPTKVESTPNPQLDRVLSQLLIIRNRLSLKFRFDPLPADVAEASATSFLEKYFVTACLPYTMEPLVAKDYIWLSDNLAAYLMEKPTRVIEQNDLNRLVYFVADALQAGATTLMDKSNQDLLDDQDWLIRLDAALLQAAVAIFLHTRATLPGARPSTCCRTGGSGSQWSGWKRKSKPAPRTRSPA